MSKRIQLTKSQRFEVFHRDGFVCQYCGRKPPSTVLEVDHIHPVSAGGGNDLDNLVTACFDCNRGKGAKQIGDVPLSQEDVIERRRAKLEQMEMLAELRSAILSQEEDLLGDAVRYWSAASGNSLDDSKLSSLRQFVKKLDIHEVFEAVDIAVARKSAMKDQWLYFCGVCWRKIKGD
jgi:hypothetical protein